MAYQPNDISHWTFDENEFDNIGPGVAFSGDSRRLNNTCDIDSGLYFPSFENDFATSNDTGEFAPKIIHSATTTSSSLCLDDEELFSGCDLGVVDFNTVPINEITVTTTPSDAENNTTDVADVAASEIDLSEFGNLTSDDIKNIFDQYTQFVEQADLQTIDESIQERAMFIEVQPPANLHARYKSDGKRQMEKSRTKPMIIQLPSLQNIALNADQSFVLRLMLTTHNENPLSQVHLHANKLEYHSSDAGEFSDGTIWVLLTPADIQNGKKVLSRIQPIKTKLDAYHHELTPLDLSDIASIDEEEETMSVQEAKVIFKRFNLKASRIICQLLIKQNQSYCFTNITCETQQMEEKKPKVGKKKRSIESDEEEEIANDRPSTSKSKSTKRKKRSH